MTTNAEDTHPATADSHDKEMEAPAKKESRKAYDAARNKKIFDDALRAVKACGINPDVGLDALLDPSRPHKKMFKKEIIATANQITEWREATNIHGPIHYNKLKKKGELALEKKKKLEERALTKKKKLESSVKAKKKDPSDTAVARRPATSKKKTDDDAAAAAADTHTATADMQEAPNKNAGYQRVHQKKKLEEALRVVKAVGINPNVGLDPYCQEKMSNRLIIRTADQIIEWRKACNIPPTKPMFYEELKEKGELALEKKKKLEELDLKKTLDSSAKVTSWVENVVEEELADVEEELADVEGNKQQEEKENLRDENNRLQKELDCLQKKYDKLESDKNKLHQLYYEASMANKAKNERIKDLEDHLGRLILQTPRVRDDVGPNELESMAPRLEKAERKLDEMARTQAKQSLQINNTIDDVKENQDILCKHANVLVECHDVVNHNSKLLTDTQESLKDTQDVVNQHHNILKENADVANYNVDVLENNVKLESAMTKKVDVLTKTQAKQATQINSLIQFKEDQKKKEIDDKEIRKIARKPY